MSQSARPLAQSRALRRIVDPVHRLCAIDMPEPERWARISEVLEAALADPDLQTAARSWPKSHDRTNNRYTNLLFYEDPDFGFVINGLVKDETGRTPVHDHGHAWVAYGLLEGAETVLRYQEPAPEGAAASGLESNEQLSGGSSESRTIEPEPSAVERAVKKSAPTTSTIATTTTTTTTTARALTVQEVFEGCADPWDGNHNGLEALIRAVLNDPGSMETHGTYYFTTDDLDDGLVTIKLDYGARNSFGGMVRTSAWAEMRPHCEIAEVIDYGF